VGGARPEGLGIPDGTIPVAPAATTVPARDFGVSGTLTAGVGHDEAARYAVLYGAGDVAVDWLRAGEALSAVWLAAVERGLSVLPISAPIEIASTREALRRLLADIGYPHLVLRLGRVDPNAEVPAQTPRLAPEQVIAVEEPG
jgi:nitroreductase